MRRIKISGKVIIRQGNKIIVEKSNDILPNGYKWLCSMWLCASIASVNIGSKLFTIKTGKGSSENTYNTTSLETEITTAPSITTGRGIIGSGSSYNTNFLASWPSGVLNEQLSEEESIEELGLFFGMCDNQTTRWTSATWAQGCFSRIVLGDDAFIPDSNTPISVEWIIGVDFV